MADPYYDDLWFVVEEDDEPFRTYHTKAGVTRRLRIDGLQYYDDGFPLQSVAVYDHHPDEPGALVAFIPAPLWMQLIAGRQR